MIRSLLRAAAAAALLACAAAPAAAQDILLELENAGGADRLVVDSSGTVVMTGFVRDVGNTSGCAAQLPVTGAGTRFMWIPCRGAVRFGRVPTGQNNWDDANLDDFSFAGGNQVTASGYGAFSFGDQVNVSSTVGVGFGSGITVSGTAGFSAGASNVCSGFACTAIGYTTRAGGQGSVALGYRTTANNDYSVSIGYRASNNGHTGTMVMGDESTTDSVRAQVDNEFRARYAGGFRFRTSAASNAAPGVAGNTGCDLPAGSGSWSCSSSRTVKEDFLTVASEDVLARVRAVPVTTWRYRDEDGLVTHMGPVAEDFWRAFGLGTGESTIGSQDIDGVNFAGVRALEARTRALAEENDALRTELEAERERVGALESRLARLEALLEQDG